jgi:drug/metabolite transporter (DMT)-like permease
MSGVAAPGASSPDIPLRRLVPVVFVLIWSTGFVVARLAMPHADPLAFLSLRFALSALALGLWLGAVRAPLPKGRVQWGHLAVTGVLMQAGYLGGVWCAVKDGLGAGMAALIVGLQPVLTAVWIRMMGREHRIGGRQWLGLALGLGGLLLVVWQKLHLGQIKGLDLALGLVALASITAGTLYQKRWVAPCDVRSASFVQMLAALGVTVPLAWWQGLAFDGHPDLLVALAWSVLVLTLGGSSLLTLLIQRGAATAVSSLMYLVPPCTAVLAWWLFDETLTPLVLAGLALTAGGVALVVRESRPQPALPSPPLNPS